MRQFAYRYRSYMKNRHGFVNMVPHAKFLHPYMGFSGADSEPVFRTGSKDEYSKTFCSAFINSDMTFEHKVKLFFPEIKHGVVSVSDVKYSVENEDENDDVSFSYKVIEGPKYKEYFVIEDFSVEFTIEITVDFGDRNSVVSPTTILCDFIDIYVHNQKITITTHDNSLLFIPYLISYRTDFPPEIARLDTDFKNVAVNSDQQYGFIVDDLSYDKLLELKLDPSMIDLGLLNTKKRITGMISDAGNEGGSFLDATSIAAYGGVGKKYMFTLPQAIFPDKMTLNGLPVFDSELSSSCCKHHGKAWGSAYFKQYEVPIPAKIEMPIECEDTPPECQEMTAYEIRNKVIDGYILFSEKTWDELDRLSSAIANSEKQRVDALNAYIEEDIS